MKHFEEFMKAGAILAKEYVAKRELSVVEKEFLTYFTVLALSIITITGDKTLNALEKVPMLAKIDELMRSTTKLATHILQKDERTEAEANFLTAFTIMSLDMLTSKHMH